MFGREYLKIGNQISKLNSFFISCGKVNDYR